jgi:hypothetical protein
MPNKPGHRRFGNVRKLPSGRYQVRYGGLAARMRSHPETFARKGDADRAVSLLGAQLIAGEWTDPQRGRVNLGEYARIWIMQRTGLRPRTVDLYRWLLAKHIEPYLGKVPIGKISTQLVREWRADLLSHGVSATMAAKALGCCARSWQRPSRMTGFCRVTHAGSGGRAVSTRQNARY